MGHRRAYATVKEQAMPPLTEMRTPISEEVTVAATDDGTFTSFCDNPKQVGIGCPATLQDVPCILLDWDNYYLKLRVEQELLDVGNLTLSHDKITADPQQPLHQITTYWMPFWNTNQQEPQQAVLFQRFLDTVPQVVPGVAPEIDSCQRWQHAVATPKSSSARGSDAISSQELKMLPASALDHLRLVVNGFTHGSPAEFMIAITVPVPTVVTIPMPGQVRPLPILLYLYRLWAGVCA